MRTLLSATLAVLLVAGESRAQRSCLCPLVDLSAAVFFASRFVLVAELTTFFFSLPRDLLVLLLSLLVAVTAQSSKQ